MRPSRDEPVGSRCPLPLQRFPPSALTRMALQGLAALGIRGRCRVYARADRVQGLIWSYFVRLTRHPSARVSTQEGSTP